MVRVEVVSSEQGFHALEEDWRRIVCESSQESYSLTWEYALVTWRHFAAGREPFVLVARADDGVVAGLLPLAIARKSFGPFSLRRLEFLIRSEHPEHFVPYDGENVDILSLPDFTDAVTSAFLAHLERNRSSWDVADLGWLWSDSHLLSHFTASSRLAMTETSPSYITTLPEDWTTYEQTVLGKSESKRISRHGRRLERDYPEEVDYHLVTDREEVAPAMDHLIEINRRRWTSVGQATVFDDDRFVRFHREYVEAAFDSGMVRLYQLRVGDQVLATTCGIVLNGSYHLFQKGFDPEWSKYGPGAVLQAFELRKAIDEGSRIYDWAHGARESKIMWIDHTRDDYKVIAPSTWKGALYVGKQAGMAKAKTIVRRLLPDPTYHRLKNAAMRLLRR